jgi:hypothetical protein
MPYGLNGRLAKRAKLLRKKGVEFTKSTGGSDRVYPVRNDPVNRSMQVFNVNRRFGSEIGGIDRSERGHHRENAASLSRFVHFWRATWLKQDGQ